MRLILTVSPLKNTPQPVNPYFIQSFIYKLLEKTEYAGLHLKERYKNFCFSNIFPYEKNKPLKSGNSYHLLFSSPDEDFTRTVKNKISDIDILRFGDHLFSLEKIKPLSPKLTRKSRLRTATPAVCSIPKDLFSEYNLDSSREYLYWNSKMPLNAFVDAVSKNSVRKYNQYYEKNLSEELLLFQTFRFKRGAVVSYKDAEIAGSLWSFTPDPRKKSLRVLQFILDTGLGEKNSAGFGFLNIIE